MSSIHSDKVQQWLSHIKDEKAQRQPNDELRRQLRDKDELLRQMERRIRGGEDAQISPDLILQVVAELQGLREIITGVISMEREREATTAELKSRMDSLEVNYNRNTQRIVDIEDSLSGGDLPSHNLGLGLGDVEAVIRELDDRMCLLEAQPQDVRSEGCDSEKIDALEERLQVLNDEHVRFAIKVVDDKRRNEAILERLIKMCQKFEDGNVTSGSVSSQVATAKPADVPFPPPPQSQFVVSLNHHPAPQKIVKETLNISRASSSSAVPVTSSYKKSVRVSSSAPSPPPEEPAQPKTPTYLPSTPMPSPSPSVHLNATPQSKDRRFGVPQNK